MSRWDVWSPWVPPLGVVTHSIGWCTFGGAGVRLPSFWAVPLWDSCSDQYIPLESCCDGSRRLNWGSQSKQKGSPCLCCFLKILQSNMMPMLFDSGSFLHGCVSSSMCRREWRRGMGAQTEVRNGFLRVSTWLGRQCVGGKKWESTALQRLQRES